ncbi:hypothetical protein SeLEV6574_g00457 [Synchytrium endobioticum]|nr:hypothetical protein SeLEV6574_g00457 [Synchytrium endobioticum]
MSAASSSIQIQLAAQAKRTLRQSVFDLKQLLSKWSQINTESTAHVNTTASYLIELELSKAASNWLPSVHSIPKLQSKHEQKLKSRLQDGGLSLLSEKYIVQFRKISDKINELEHIVGRAAVSEHLDEAVKVVKNMGFGRFHELFKEVAAMYRKEVELKEGIVVDLLSTISDTTSCKDEDNGDGSSTMNMITVRSSAWFHQPYIDETRCSAVCEALEYQIE